MQEKKKEKPPITYKFDPTKLDKNRMAATHFQVPS